MRREQGQEKSDLALKELVHSGCAGFRIIVRVEPSRVADG